MLSTFRTKCSIVIFSMPSGKKKTITCHFPDFKPTRKIKKNEKLKFLIRRKEKKRFLDYKVGSVLLREEVSQSGKLHGCVYRHQNSKKEKKKTFGNPFYERC
jgi:hypothetical protein